MDEVQLASNETTAPTYPDVSTIINLIHKCKPVEAKSIFSLMKPYASRTDIDLTNMIGTITDIMIAQYILYMRNMCGGQKFYEERVLNEKDFNEFLRFVK